MNYGLNNNLGNANNTNRTQNSAKSNKYLKAGKGILDVAGALDGLKSGGSWFDRVKGIAQLIASGGQSGK